MSGALYCHKCGKKVSVGTNCNSPGPNEQQQQQISATARDGLLSFAVFRTKGEEDRAQFFKPKGPSAKKAKIH